LSKYQRQENLPNGLCQSIEAIKEALWDVEEGADMVIKPGIAYLDIVREVKMR
jgi:delta-aminolevulinic acid dehydratase/porphobilinogen synthase